jgi:hypothetical protein
MKLTVSTTVDIQSAQEDYTSTQYTKIFEIDNTTIFDLLLWATKIQKAHSMHSFTKKDDYFANISDIKIGVYSP